MKIRLDARKTAWQNASDYYDAAKKARAKRANALAAIEEVKKKIAALEKTRDERAENAPPATRETHPKTEKSAKNSSWSDAFHSFKTSGGFLVVAGKNAKQNDLLVARHFNDADVFLHATVQGAPATIVKNGASAGEQDLLEAAQWAAAYSSAWKQGVGVTSVYAARRGQVGKYSHGEYVAKGGFVIRGERKWFKHVELRLIIAKSEDADVIALPAAHTATPKNAFLATPGGSKKSDAARKIAEQMDVSAAEVEKLLPGSCRIEKT